MRVSPSIYRIAFNCPHCGAYTSQRWWQLFAEPVENNQAPNPPSEDWIKELCNDPSLTAERREQLRAHGDKILSGLVFLDSASNASYSRTTVENLNLSECFVCKKIAVWGRMFGAKRTNGCRDLSCPRPMPVSSAMQADLPNADLPEDIRGDYEEAGRIVDVSPRGAAALLRLAIQKLCIQLGETEKIDTAIANLVKKGLSPLLQQSLDAVRVIGNEAVHPGEMDLRDDRQTAGQLFKVVNIIAEQMISAPKHVADLYQKLPPEKVKAIERRDKAAKPTVPAE